MKLTDVCDFQGGSQPPKSEWTDIPRDGYIRMLQIRDYTQENSKIEYIKITNSTKICKEDDILIARYGASVGKILTGLSGAYNVAMMKVIIDENKVNREYIYNFLKSNVFQNYIKNVGQRAAQAGFNKEELSRININLPKLEKQENVVKELSKVQEIIDIREKQIRNLDELIKSKFVEMFGNCSYEKVLIKDAIERNYIEKPLDGNHGNKHPKASDYVESGVPFLMANNLENGCVDLINCNFITKKQADSLDKGFARNNDVLITHKGTIGRTAILHTDYEYVMLTPQITYYRANCDYLLPEYLKAYFDSEKFQSVMKNVASSGSTRAYIGITEQQKLELIIPPIELQNKFTVFVKLIDKQKIELQKSLEEMEKLQDSLMNKYFS